MTPRSPRLRQPGRRAPLVVLALVVALAMALGAGAARAPAAGPPGMNTLFFSPSGSGGCGDGQVSALGEASAPAGQSPTSPTVVTASNGGLVLPNNPGGKPFWTLDGLYASGMAATSWNYSFGYPWPREGNGQLTTLGGTVPGWSTVVYFTSTCGSPLNLQNYILAQCYQANGSGPLGGCRASDSECMGPGCPGPQPKAAWGAYTTAGTSGSASSFVGKGLALDTTRNILYFTTAPNGCTGSDTCTVSVWSSPTAAQYGQQLSPTLVTTIAGITSPSYMAVDPIGQTLYLTGRAGADVISVPTSGGQASTVLSGSQWISGGLVIGMAFDPSTGVLYVMSPQTGDEPNQITQVPVSGGSPSVLFTPGAMATLGEVSGLAVDPANAFAAWGVLTHGSKSQGSANSIIWGSLDTTPSGGPSSVTYEWTGAADASYAANIFALAIAGGVGTCQYEGATFPCPTTTVGASGVTAREAPGGTVAIPIRAYRVAVDGPAPPAQAAEHAGVAPAPVRGPMVLAFRDRRSGRTLATTRPGFTVRVNSQGVRRVTIPTAARDALRSGHLEVRVRSRNAGKGQRWRMRTLRVLPR